MVIVVVTVFIVVALGRPVVTAGESGQKSFGRGIRPRKAHRGPKVAACFRLPRRVSRCAEVKLFLS